MTRLGCTRPLFLPLLAALVVLQAPTPCSAGLWTSKTEEDIAVPADEATKEHSVDTPVEYGVDVSFPMHRRTASTNYPWLPHNVDPSIPTPQKYQGMPIQPLGDRQAFYDDFIDSCVSHFGKKGSRCIETDKDRVTMSLRQPQSMQNYTTLGYKKIRAPEDVFKLIKHFWEINRNNTVVEQWGVGNTYTNNWQAPSSMVSVEDKKLRGGGYSLKQKIWNVARDTIQEWTGEELTQCSLYGIRVYHEGSVLATHVDRLPLVSSAIINVDQDLDEPWPLEVIGHDGKAANVTMEPGDMILYESHSVLHGRPFPLKGRFMANIFIHFEPTGHSLRHTTLLDEGDIDVHAKYKEDVKRGVSGHEIDNGGLPSYVIPGTPEESHWRSLHPGGVPAKQVPSFTTGSSSAHIAAQTGDLDGLQSDIKKKRELVDAKDANGWTPLHEGARGGHLEVVKYLIDSGANANATTGKTRYTALYWAKQELYEGHPMISFLESLGVVEIGPEL